VKDPEGREVEVDEMGGLHIIGSERHESRRIDRQLRGRAGRQGDPGASQFFLSLEDDLMRLFGSERIAKIMDRLGAQEGEVLTHSLITRSIEKAQQRVELQNFQSRKRLLEYDDVMNQQREVIYSLRSFALEGGEELKGEALGMIERAVAKRVETALAAYEEQSEWDYGLLHQDLLMHYLLVIPDLEDEDRRPTTLEGVRSLAVETGQAAFATKNTSLGEHAAQVLSLVMLNVLDEKWKDHLYDLDQLRGAIHYRSWGQKDPLIEYKHEAYNMFVDLMADIANTFTERFLRVQLMPPAEAFGPPPGTKPGGPGKPTKKFNALGIAEEVPSDEPPSGTDSAMDIGPDEAPKPGSVAKPDPVITGPRGALRPPGKPAGGAPVDWSAVGRNDPCPCGSGKKFKKCHGATA
jgi:preprotein translocase subunit SecA